MIYFEDGSSLHNLSKLDLQNSYNKLVSAVLATLSGQKGPVGGYLSRGKGRFIWNHRMTLGLGLGAAGVYVCDGRVVVWFLFFFSFCFLEVINENKCQTFTLSMSIFSSNSLLE